MAGIRTPRPPSYVSRETGAAELDISADTWDAMVKAGQLPPPIRVGISGTTPRWRWEDVDAALAGRTRPVLNEAEPFFREMGRGEAKNRGRAAS